MTSLTHKIDFALVLSVKHANPNGDPIDGNRPRTTLEGKGEISDVCLKRKLRNRLQDEGYPILVQSDERRSDEHRSLADRIKSMPALQTKDKNFNRDDFARIACETWLDVRTFGQVFALSGKDKDSAGTSIGVRGAVSLHSAFSVETIDISSIQITKSVNLETNAKNPDQKGSDTMGMKHRVERGIYVTYGAMNVQLAEKTGFSMDDAKAVQQALLTLFRNDASSARPEGSMEVLHLIWWEHDCKHGQYSAAKVHRSLTVHPDGSFDIAPLAGLIPEILEGE